MTFSDESTPLWVTPLLNFKKSELESGHYETVQRIVTAAPNPGKEESEIETAVEIFIGPAGSALWRRVVVRSGPSCPKQAVHASYMLPNDRQPLTSSSSLVCWAAFPEQPHHKFLCVLGNPTLLCIYDVYPKGHKSGLGGEGHSIPLPFEACGIHSIGGGQGLLLQRAETLEDGIGYDDHHSGWASGLQGEEDDDGFVLKAPPRPVRIRESTGTSFGSLSLQGSSSAVPSLFSLSHPLDDILPVCDFSGGDLFAAPFDDIFEKILFVDVVRWIDTTEAAKDRIERLQPICITYHTQRKRHAIWEIKNSPEPPPQAPLWKASSQWRANDGWDSHLGVLQQDLDDMELLRSPDGDTSHFETATRNEALADALGVRKTPRKAVDEIAPRTRGGQARSNRKRPSKAAAANMSLLSPLSRPMNETMTDVDTAVETVTRPPLLSLGPFASLHPKIAMACIYEENGGMAQATNIFLVSNNEGSGTVTVCLVGPGNSASNPNEIRLCSLQANAGTIATLDGLGQRFEVVSGPSFPCIAAAPLKSSPIPRCFLAQGGRNEARPNDSVTDLLILGDSSRGHRKLSLYRNSMYIVDCDIKETPGISRGTIVHIGNAVGNRVDLSIMTDTNKMNCVRATISLTMDSSFIGNRVIQAIESALFLPSFLESRPDGIAIAIKLRADCVRLEQALLASSIESSSLMEDVGSSAVGSVVAAVFALELLEMNINKHNVHSIVSPSIRQSAWESLLCSEYHQAYLSDSPEFFLEDSSSSRGLSDQLPGSIWQWDQLAKVNSFALETLKSLDYSISGVLFDALHFIYEDFKLHGNSRDAGMRFVGTILCQVCILSSPSIHPSKSLFIGHYKRDLGDKWYQRIVSSTSDLLRTGERSTKVQRLSSFDVPPCIFSWIDAVVSGKAVDCGFSALHETLINATCTRSKSLIRIFSVLYDRDQSVEVSDNDRHKCRDRNVVNALIEEGFNDKKMLHDQLPAGIVVPLLELLYRCRSENASLGVTNEDAAMWSLIGRDDLCKNASRESSLDGAPVNNPGLPSSLEGSINQRLQLEDRDNDGVCPLEITSSMLFPNDNRIREVGRLLRSSRPTYLNVPRAIEVSDHDYERLKQEKLLLLSQRVLALPVGRGMFTIGNLQPVPAEPLPLPEISLVGRVPPTDAKLALDTSETPSDLKVWPEFHNGVAAGLRLPLEVDAGEIISKITRTWIVYNRPDEISSSSQSNTNNNPSSTPPSQMHAHGGLLMALGLRGHLTTLEMTDIFDYLTQGTVTTTVGVLLGMAVNMRGSCDISVSKMLCLHIPSLIPQHFSAIDVASPVQAAAVAGAGLLYQGSSHRMMTEFLLNEIGKRPTNDLNVFDREAYTLSCGFALGMVNLCRGDGVKCQGAGTGNAGLSDLRIEDRLYRYIVGGLDDAEMRRQREESDRLSLPSASSTNGNEKCSCIHEGDSINTDVTAPGATLALGLIYMMSGNKTIASAIALPDTHFLLEYVRPDFLMLRVIARALILWNDVKPTNSWIESQLPKAAADAYGKMRKMAQSISHRSTASASIPDDKHFDRQAVRLIYAHVVSGACFAIGLRFAGTGNREAVAAVYERVMELRDLRDGNDAVSCALRPPVPVLEMCLGCAAISLSMILAGSGDLEVLRLLKVLRWRHDIDVNYGSHQAYGTAIGLLFLGGGTCTLGREPEDIAALVMAFYPRFPSKTSDNQYHLQALRNLYAIAVKDQAFRAVDVDTGESVFVPIQVHFEDENVHPLKLTAPCLLFNTDAKPRELRVVSERYYPVTLNLDSHALKRIIFVKRRSAHLSYIQDPHSQRSLLVQTGSFQGHTSLDLIASFTDDQHVLSFAQHLCEVDHLQPKSAAAGPFTVPGFCSRVLHECLLLDSQEALPLYLALRSAISSLQAGIRSGVTYVWDFRIIRSYYEQRRQLVPDSSPRLLNSEIVAYLFELLEKALMIPEGVPESKNSGKPALHNASQSVYFDVPLSDNAIVELNSGQAMDMS